MAVDEFLLDRMRTCLQRENVEWSEKRMFGGVCFMIDDKMAFGTYKDGLMLRVAPEEVNELILKAGAEQMIHGGRPMKGYLFVQDKGYDQDADLEFWINRTLEFNPRAKSSKKK